MKIRVLIATAAVVAAASSGAMAAPKWGHCPPGLAKKAVPCVPPGQVGKSWRPGDRLSAGDYVVIPRDDWERLGLPRLYDGSGYVGSGNQILRVALDTLIVIEAVRRLSAALN